MERFVNYPINSHENPFNVNSNGKYFAYLTNRKACYSYLSNDLADFDFRNNELLHAMPMGYTNLHVLERLFIVDSVMNVYNFSSEKYSKISIHRYNEYSKEEIKDMFGDEGWNNFMKDHTQKLSVKNCMDDTIKCAVEFQKGLISKFGISKFVLLGTGLIHDYGWH